MAVPKNRKARAKKLAKIRRKQLEIAMKKVEFTSIDKSLERDICIKLALKRVHLAMHNSRRRTYMDHVGNFPRIGSGIPDVPVEVPMPVSNNDKKAH